MKVRPYVCFTLSILLPIALALATSAQGKRFAVQLGASPDRAEAEAKLKEAQAQKLEAYLVKSNVPGKGIFYRVRFGNFATRAAAEKATQQFKASGALSDYYVADYETPEMAMAPATPAMTAKAAPTPSTPKPTPTPMVATQPITPPAGLANNNSPSLGNSPAAKPAVPPTPIPSNRPATANPPVTGGSVASAAPTAKPTGSASVLGGYTKFQDDSVGYSFEHPAYWVGGPLSGNDMQAQKITGGAMFKSNEDQAFLNAIWNKLDKANSGEHDNDMIVDLILKSMASGNGTQNMAATNRTVITDGQQIKTFLDLKAAFQVPNQTSPLDFIGKGVIIRASKGILLVVTFYAKDAPQTVAMAADHIIKTAKTPE